MAHNLMSNSKLTRILKQLQSAQDKGVEEIDLFIDWEKKGNARVIKHRINKIIGNGNSIVTINGIWYLAEEYWNMDRSQFKELMNRHDLRELSIRNNIITLAVVSVLAMLVIIAFIAGTMKFM